MNKSSKAFLNQDGFHSDASICYEISVEQSNSKHKPWANCSLSIRDCTDRVNLELDIHSESSMDNTIYKIDTMMEYLRKVKREIKIARREFEKLTKRCEEEQ